MMHWNLVIYAILALTVAILGFILYNYFQNIRPGREKKIAMAISANEELVLSLICRVSGSVSQTSLLRELPGLENPGRHYHTLGRLREKRCIAESGKNHYRATGRGRRIAAILAVTKSKKIN